MRNFWHAFINMRKSTPASRLESTEKATVPRAPPGRRHFLVATTPKKNSASLGTFRITPPTPAPNDLRECHENQYHARRRLLQSSSGLETRGKGRRLGSTTATGTSSHLQMKCACHSEENKSDAVQVSTAAPSTSLARENHCQFDLFVPVIIPEKLYFDSGDSIHAGNASAPLPLNNETNQTL